MIEKIRDNIYRLPIELPDTPLRELNSYVIVGKERSLLIDTGFNLPVCREAMTGHLQELGLRPGDLDIFLTHRHPDHIGLVRSLLGPDSKVYIGWPDAKPVRLPGGAKSREELLDTLLRLGMPQESAREFTGGKFFLRDEDFPPPEKLIPLDDGDRLEAGGYTFACVLTPGHTAGHLCLWEEREKILFSGDHVLFDISPNIGAWEFPSGVLEEFIASLHKVDGLLPELVLPGHRGRGDFHARVQALIRHHDDRLLECLRIILDHPGSTAYQIASRLSWKFREKEWDKAPLFQQWFAMGECIAHIGYLMNRDNVAMETDLNGVFHFLCQTESVGE